MRPSAPRASGRETGGPRGRTAGPLSPSGILGRGPVPTLRLARALCAPGNPARSSRVLIDRYSPQLPRPSCDRRLRNPRREQRVFFFFFVFLFLAFRLWSFVLVPPCPSLSLRVPDKCPHKGQATGTCRGGKDSGWTVLGHCLWAREKFAGTGRPAAILRGPCGDRYVCYSVYVEVSGSVALR